MRGSAATSKSVLVARVVRGVADVLGYGYRVETGVKRADLKGRRKKRRGGKYEFIGLSELAMWPIMSRPFFFCFAPNFLKTHYGPNSVFRFTILPPKFTL